MKALPNGISYSDIVLFSVSCTNKNAPLQPISVPVDKIISSSYGYIMQRLVESLMKTSRKANVKHTSAQMDCNIYYPAAKMWLLFFHFKYDFLPSWLNLS